MTTLQTSHHRGSSVHRAKTADLDSNPAFLVGNVVCLNSLSEFLDRVRLRVIPCQGTPLLLRSPWPMGKMGRNCRSAPPSSPFAGLSEPNPEIQTQGALCSWNPHEKSALYAMKNIFDCSLRGAQLTSIACLAGLSLSPLPPLPSSRAKAKKGRAQTGTCWESPASHCHARMGGGGVVSTDRAQPSDFHD